MAIDRLATVKKAEGLVQAGKFESAIDEYARVFEEYPDDWSVANTLGDLHMRAGQKSRAAELFLQIGDALNLQGFVPKAIALYKKALKARPGDEHALSSLAMVAVHQELFADARLYLGQLLQQRRQRGDDAGVTECETRLATLPDRRASAQPGGRPSVPSVDAGTGAAPARLERTRAEDAPSGSSEPGAVPLNADAPRSAPDILEVFGEVSTPDQADPAPTLVPVMPPPATGAARLSPTLSPGPTVAPPATVDVEIVELGDLLDQAETESAQPAVPTPALHVVSVPLTPVDRPSLFPPVSDAPPSSKPDAVQMATSAEGLSAAVSSPVPPPLGASGAPPAAQTADPAPPAPRTTPPAAVTASEQPVFGARTGDAPRANVRVPAAADRTAVDPTPTVATVDDRTTADRAAVSGAASDGTAAAPAAAPPASAAAPPALAAALPALAAPPPAPAAPVVAIPAAAPAPEVTAAATPAAAGSAASAGRAMSSAVARSVAELEAAAASPAFEFRAAAELGRIWIRQGDLPQAAKWLERAAEVPSPVPEQGVSVRYDLGDTLERMECLERALDVFRNIEMDAGDYRDVRERIARLEDLASSGRVR